MTPAKRIFTTVFFYLLGLALAQSESAVEDTLVAERSSPYVLNTSLYLDITSNDGNTKAEMLYYGLRFSIFGDYGPFKDAEFALSYLVNDAVVNEEVWEDDENLVLKFDLWANQRFSPFLFLQNQKDAIVGLNNRFNYGIGGKVNLIYGSSISYALLDEKENYTIYKREIGSIDTVESEYYYYEYDYDTTFVDVKEDSIRDFARHSIRPRLKLSFFEGNILFDYRFYYKPKIDDFEDYLLENELKINISTFYEALSIYIEYKDSFNSRYDKPNARFKPKDSEVSLGFQFDL